MGRHLESPDRETKLYAVTKKKVSRAYANIYRIALKPWLFFNAKKAVKVTKPSGEQIAIEGAEYSGTTRLVFLHNFIEPFLEDAIEQVLNDTAQTCREHDLKPEPYIQEAVDLIQGLLIDRAYNEMIGIDRRLRGKGYPQNVKRIDMSDKIAEMDQCLEGHARAATMMARGQRKESAENEAKKTDSGRVKRNEIFISHAAEDRKIAGQIQEQIETIFGKSIRVFVSSVEGAIDFGSEWLDEIIDRLLTADSIIVLITPVSVKRSFVWFEIGFSWLRRLNEHCEIYPFCVPPIEPDEELPEPLRRLQAVAGGDEAEIEIFFRTLIRRYDTGNIDVLDTGKIIESFPEYPKETENDPQWAMQNIHLSDQLDAEALSDEAKQLLIAAAKSDGNIMRIGTNQGLIVKANNIDFAPENDPRSEAIWEGAVNELHENELIEDKGHKGEVFAVTRKGYEYVDKLMKESTA